MIYGSALQDNVERERERERRWLLPGEGPRTYPKGRVSHREILDFERAGCSVLAIVNTQQQPALLKVKELWIP